MIKTRTALSMMFVGLLSLTGCATHQPTISHIHIGHAVDGWPDTPGQASLFTTAENSAKAAKQAAESAVVPQADLNSIKNQVAQVVKATDPAYHATASQPDKKEYGVKNALAESAHHITYAAESPDSSANVRASAPKFNEDATYVLNRCDLITALGDEVLNSTSPQEAQRLSQELLKLTAANLDGDDSNGDGIVGSSPEEYGVKQLRAELDAMIDREDPPYTTVDKWYLFNLIRLPSGEWILRQLTGSGSGKASGY